MIKFRSMKLDANPNLAPSDMDEKNQKSMETGFGNFLRKTSLDELLQFIHLIDGKMSLIGPRPFLETERADIANKEREEALQTLLSEAKYYVELAENTAKFFSKIVFSCS